MWKKAVTRTFDWVEAEERATDCGSSAYAGRRRRRT